MNFKKMMFLGIALVSTADQSYAMARTDAQILQSVKEVGYTDFVTMERYTGFLPGDRQIAFVRLPGKSGEADAIVVFGAYSESNFITDEARQEGFNILREKYNEQEGLTGSKTQ
jgi:hypothetical protein